MIGTIFRISLLNLKRDRVSLLLTFVLPIVFFSIFASVFGNQGGDGTSRVKLAIVDEDKSEPSKRLIADLSKDKGLRVTLARKDGTMLDRASAQALVKEGKLPVAIIVPKGFGETFGTFGGEGIPVDLMADKSDPVAPQLVFGLLQKAAMTSAPDLLAERGLGMFRKYGGAFTPQQEDAMGRFLPRLREQAGGTVSGKPPGSGDREQGHDAGAAGEAQFSGLVRVNTIDVLGEKKSSGLIAFYAAGTGVMFLLFSMTGASGTLLDDEESGTLERVLTSNVGMGGLLIGKWIFIVLIGMAQLTVMFVWGALAFKLELMKHLGGFALMTIATAAAAGGFGLVLATASRTRQQLSGISTIVILVMSAVGGSMFPRFLMSETMQKAGLLTFNAWALDGFQKVFWYELPIASLWPQLVALSALTAVFLIVARLLARRWETV